MFQEVISKRMKKEYLIKTNTLLKYNCLELVFNYLFVLSNISKQ